MSKEDWEGFEHFHDATDTKPLLEIDVAPLSVPQVSPPKHFKPSNKRSPIMRKVLSREAGVKQQFFQLSPAKENTVDKEEEEEMEKFQRQEDNGMKQETTEKQVEPKKEGEKHWRDEIRFSRIPILKFEEELSRPGRVVYRGFLGRTSDYVLRNLREADWEGQKKRELRNLHGIEFSSQFEGGNLGLAVEVGSLEYDLYLRVDSNTQGHRQWFFFSMRNTHPCTVRLRLLRFKKYYSLFQRGMRPYARSRYQSEWHAAGQDVLYRPENSVKKGQLPKSFVLSFSYTFQQAQDEVFLAAGIPYTYSHLQRELKLLKTLSSQREDLVWETSSIGRSTVGLDIPLISVYHRLAKLLPSPPSYIVINCRSHPGEASSSWVLDGLMRQLASSKEMEEFLLSMNLEFRIVPMLNPDGVVLGNYRTGILGEDLNRQFGGRLRGETRMLAKMVKTLTDAGKVLLFLDLHGHSVLKNSFIYGPNEVAWGRSKLKWLPERLFHRSKYFRLASCRFQNPPADTARSHFEEQHIISLTCQNSLGLYQAHQQTFQMLAGDWSSFGQSLLHALKDTIQNQSHAESQPLTYLKSKISQNRPLCKTKHQKVHLKVVADPPLWSSSKGISREDDPLELQQKKQETKPLQVPIIKKDFRPRRLSQVAKTPESCSPIKKFINRETSDLARHVPTELFSFERSMTCDQSTLHQDVSLTLTNTQSIEEKESCAFKEKAEGENFSDEYESINDSDTSSDDLPEQDRQYLLECVGEGKIEEPTRNRTLSREPRIGKFKEMRFNSMEGDQDWSVRAPVGKPKLEPHKFQVATTKSLLAEGEVEFSFWQKKQLNQRVGPLRRTQKDPFLLIQRKDKFKQV